MPTDPDVISAIESALAGEPGNAPLRVHLAGLLLEAGRPGDALAQLELVLAATPDHLDALGLATTAGTTLGDPRAPGWARLHAAIGGEPEASPRGAQPFAPPEPEPEPAPAPPTPTAPEPFAAQGGTVGSGGSDQPDWDQFLREVLEDAGQLEPITLADVGGLRDVKERLELSFLAPMRNPELRRAYGAHVRGGLLLWGPPGCGKTFLARAVAGELGARFVTVGLHNVLDMWLGNSEKQLHELFELARRSTPCVLFFDEVDAIGHARMDLGRSAARNVVAQLLTELDGIEHSNEGLFVIGATNQPWDVDPALRRPGRFDRTMLLLPPDAEARAAMFRFHLRDRPLGPVDIDQLATELAASSDGLSGADIRLVCDEAAERALAEAIRTSTVQPITADQLRGAIAGTRPSADAWFESARNHVRYANNAGEYDELADHLRRRRRR